jgi:predicted transcriptional regulator
MEDLWVRKILLFLLMKSRKEKSNINHKSIAQIKHEEMESINAGLADVKAGRIHSHADVMTHINKKLNR